MTIKSVIEDGQYQIIPVNDRSMYVCVNNLPRQLTSQQPYFDYESDARTDCCSANNLIYQKNTKFHHSQIEDTPKFMKKVMDVFQQKYTEIS